MKDIFKNVTKLESTKDMLKNVPTGECPNEETRKMMKASWDKILKHNPGVILETINGIQK